MPFKIIASATPFFHIQHFSIAQPIDVNNLAAVLNTGKNLVPNTIMFSFSHKY